jgi:hypothetical protein
MMPLLQGQQCQLNNGKDTCTTTMATTTLSWGRQLQSQQQQRCKRIDSNNAITTRASMPDQQRAIRATMLAQQWQRCLCIDNINNAIVKRVTIAIATIAE